MIMIMMLILMVMSNMTKYGIFADADADDNLEDGHLQGKRGPEEEAKVPGMEQPGNSHHHQSSSSSDTIIIIMISSLYQTITIMACRRIPTMTKSHYAGILSARIINDSSLPGVCMFHSFLAQRRERWLSICKPARR